MRQGVCKKFNQILEIEGDDNEWIDIFEIVKGEDPTAERMQINHLNIIMCNDVDAASLGLLTAGRAKIHKRTLTKSGD